MKKFILLSIITALIGACGHKQPQALNIADKPLFRDTIYNGAADPSVIFNRLENNWYMFYTNRRANMADTLPGAAWVHDTPIDIAVSHDQGATWRYETRARFSNGLDSLTLWAPEIIFGDSLYHMYLTVVPGVFTDWNHPRRIAHLTSDNLTDWEFQSYLKLACEKVIDACVSRVNDSLWRMWYNNEKRGKSIYYAESTDLFNWTDRGPVTHDGSKPGEGPNVFMFNSKYYMIVDEWQGLGVYRATDALNWTRLENRILEIPGTGPDDEVNGQHADVLVNNNRAYIFYFTHPDKNKEDAPGINKAKTVIQLAELTVTDSTLTCNRNKPVYIQLQPPK